MDVKNPQNFTFQRACSKLEVGQEIYMRVILAIAQCSAKSGWAVWAVAEREGDNIQQEVPLFSVS